MVGRVLAALGMACVLPAYACSPPPFLEDAGFIRHDVGHLPANARGVMFEAQEKHVTASDFTVASNEDRRASAVQVRSRPGGLLRVAPLHGFRPGAHYTFRYLRAHAGWRYPDTMRVVIDDTTVRTDGVYALDLAPRPVHRMIVVPTHSGSCVEPAPAVVQAFTYTVPAALQPYRDHLDYSAVAIVPGLRRPGIAYSPEWTDGPGLYSELARFEPLAAQGFDRHHDAVVAPCDTTWPVVQLRGVVRFPEVDDQAHATAPRNVDLAHGVAGACRPLDAMLQALDGQPFEPTLRSLCGGPIFLLGRPLRGVTPDEWAFQLWSLEYMSATCYMVGLADVMRTGRFSQDAAALDTIGGALQKALRNVPPASRPAALHALAYLAGQLPPTTQAATARRLLAPSRALLLAARHAPLPGEADDLARLSKWVQ